MPGLEGLSAVGSSSADQVSALTPNERSPALGAGAELVVLVFKQDVERGQRSVTARDVLLQVELVRFAQFAWHAVASAKEGRSRSPSARIRLLLLPG